MSILTTNPTLALSILVTNKPLSNIDVYIHFSLIETINNTFINKSF